MKFKLVNVENSLSEKELTFLNRELNLLKDSILKKIKNNNGKATKARLAVNWDSNQAIYKTFSFEEYRDVVKVRLNE